MPTTVNDKLVSWASETDPQTIRQAEKTARLPIVEGHVALMPDAHVGIGATVGSVIPTRSAVIPSAVGVDIGCGMVAAELDVTEDQLPDTLAPLLARAEKAIPAGVGKGHDRVAHAEQWLAANTPATELAADRTAKVLKQFGTLDSGNHFFELCIDERGRVWVVLHSGSRGIGNRWPRCTSPRRLVWPRTSSSGWRTRIWPISWRARRSSAPTSPTCCGPRTTPGPSASR